VHDFLTWEDASFPCKAGPKRVIGKTMNFDKAISVKCPKTVHVASNRNGLG
jgi:hypothetical protein